MRSPASRHPAPHSEGEEDRRTRVVLAAARLFRLHGYERTTVRELAEAVGMKSGSLFHHFRNKEEILVAVMANGIREAIDEGQALMQRYEHPADRLGGLFHLHMASLVNGTGGAAMHAMIYEWRSLSPEALATVRKLGDDYETLWHQAIDDAVACGLIEGDPTIIRNYVLGGMNFTVRWYREGGRYDATALADQMLQAALPAVARHCAVSRKSHTPGEDDAVHEN